jgi:hypothetical protein
MDEDYKGHHIQSVPRHLLPDSERWTAHVVINWTAGSREELRQFEVKRGFAAQEEGSLAFSVDLRYGAALGGSSMASLLRLSLATLTSLLFFYSTTLLTSYFYPLDWVPVAL